MPIEREILTRLETLERRVGNHLGPKPGESTLKVPHPGATLTARDSLPTPSDAMAYKTMVLRGTPDKQYICLRDFNGTWFWQEVTGLSDFFLEVARDRIPGHNHIHKFGKNPDIDIASGFEAVWGGGGDYTGFNATAAEVVELFSSDDADNGATATGALTVRIYGLDTNLAEITEDVTLDGVTKVDTSKSYIRLNRVLVLTAGSTGSNEGTITARQKVTTANIFAVMRIGNNQTTIAAYTVPADKTAYLLSWFGALAKKQSAFSNVRILMRQLGSVFQLKEEFDIASTGSSYVQRMYKVPKGDDDSSAPGIPAGTDIKIMADSSADGHAISAGFDLLLIDN